MPIIQSVLDVLNQSDDKETIPAVKGVLKSIYKANVGLGKNGPWSINNGVLSSEGHEIRVKFWNRSDDDLLPLKGKTIVITSVQGNRGLSGVSFVAQGYKDQPELKVSEKAEISVEGDPISKQERQKPIQSTSEQEEEDVPYEFNKATNASPSQATSQNFHGAQVGMAVNNAFAFLLQEEPGALADPATRCRTLWEIASDILRVAQRMEGGDIAPKPSDRLKEGEGHQ